MTDKHIAIFDKRGEHDICIGHLKMQPGDAASLAWLIGKGHELKLEGDVSLNNRGEYVLDKIRIKEVEK